MHRLLKLRKEPHFHRTNTAPRWLTLCVYLVYQRYALLTSQSPVGHIHNRHNRMTSASDCVVHEVDQNLLVERGINAGE